MDDERLARFEAVYHRAYGQITAYAARRWARSAELDAEIADLYGDSPDSGVELEAIGQVFRTLSDDDREVLSLLAWEGLDREEIATALGLSRNAVRIRLHRARRRFSRALAEADVRFMSEGQLFPVERPL